MIVANGLNVPTGLNDLVDPRRTILLVYDMQVGICSQIKDGNAIVARCAKLVTTARAVGMRIAFSRHLSAPPAWMGATQYRTAMAWQKTDDPQAVKPWFLRDAPGSRIVADLEPTEADLVIEKLSMSAFEGTPLAFAMRDCGVVGIALCGIALEIGIVPTVLHATDLGFVPILIEDACGSGNADARRRSIEDMRFVGEAMMTDTDTFCSQLAAGAN